MRKISTALCFIYIVALTGCVTTAVDGTITRPDPAVLAIAETALHLAHTAYLEALRQPDTCPEDVAQARARVELWADLVREIRRTIEATAPPPPD